MPDTLDPERVAVGFARVLRGAGLDVPVGTVVTYAEALAALGLDRRAGVYWAGRTTLVRKVEDVPLYDRAFRAYWQGWRDDGPAVEPQVDEITLLLDDDTLETEPPDDGDEVEEREVITVRFSAHEVLRHKDFAAYTRPRARRGSSPHGRPAARGSAATVPTPPAVATREGTSRPAPHRSLGAALGR